MIETLIVGGPVAIGVLGPTLTWLEFRHPDWLRPSSWRRLVDRYRRTPGRHRTDGRSTAQAKAEAAALLAGLAPMGQDAPEALTAPPRTLDRYSQLRPTRLDRQALRAQALLNHGVLSRWGTPTADDTWEPERELVGAR